MAKPFRACFNRGLRDDPQMAGEVRINARIGAQGEVLRAAAYGHHGLSDGVLWCTVDVVFASTFAPPAGGGATIVIPVTFVTR